MIAVFHATSSVDRTPPEALKFVHVADVDTDDLEDAFELTNSIDHCWWLNKKVSKTFIGERCRSTSVGDLALLNGVTYRCASAGWEVVQSAGETN